MIPGSDSAPATLMTSQLDQINEQIRAAAKVWLEAYETTLESIVSHQEQAASQTGVGWMAAATKSWARFTREVVKRQVSAGRTLLKATE